MRFLLLRVAVWFAVIGLLLGLLGLWVHGIWLASTLAWAMCSNCLFTRILIEGDKTEHLRSIEKRVASTTFD